MTSGGGGTVLPPVESFSDHWWEHNCVRVSYGPLPPKTRGREQQRPFCYFGTLKKKKPVS